MRLLVLITTAVSLIFIFECKAIAAVKKPVITPSPATAGVAPLSVSECLGLGGKVRFSASADCASHNMCVTVDNHGVIRAACIDKIE
jgi:putative hemolysin